MDPRCSEIILFKEFSSLKPKISGKKRGNVPRFNRTGESLRPGFTIGPGPNRNGSDMKGRGKRDPEKEGGPVHGY